MKGVIFDIKEFTLHDGSGVRTTVFLKGCPLRCIWCHNPEGLSIKPQLMVKNNLCKGCGKCFMPCAHAECAPFKRCVHACPDGLVSISGQEMTAQDFVDKLNKTLDFNKAMGGGVTLSGGEPLFQPDFTLAVLTLLDCHKAIQTCGYADPSVFQKMVDAADYIMMDIKIADRELHKKYTGVYNDVILENLDYLRNSGKEYLIRTPMIKGITDTEDNLAGIAGLIGDSPWEKLPYNDMAGAKYKMLNMKYQLEDLQ